MKPFETMPVADACVRRLIKTITRYVLSSALLGIVSAPMTAVALEPITINNPSVLNDFKFNDPVTSTATGSTNSEIATTIVNANLHVPDASCRVQRTVTVSGSVTGTASDGGAIFATGVRGIGIEYFITKAWWGAFEAITMTPFAEDIGSSESATAPLYLKAKLIATGPVGTGPLGPLPQLTFAYSAPCILQSTLTATPVTSAVVRPNTCSVSTPSIDVPMQNTDVSQILKPGSRGPSTSFNIRLSCASASNVYITLTDTTNPGNRTSTLTLAPGSTASGVGIALFNGATPIFFGPDSTDTNNINQWFVTTTTADGPILIPIAAQYVRTSGPVNPGNAEAMASFTMSYQ